MMKRWMRIGNKRLISGLLAVSFIVVFRYFFFCPFRIPTGSMIPTLMVGDFILVDMFSYNFTSFWGRQRSFSRGDVIVFRYPKNPSMYYIKRVIGLPNDTLKIKENKLYINGRLVKEIPVDGVEREVLGNEYKKNRAVRFSVQMGKKEYLIQKDNDNYFSSDYDEIKIPEGKYFVMGDNRDFSYDSRFWGLLERENIIGKAVLTWFSMIFPWEEENFAFRPRRIGKLIR